VHWSAIRRLVALLRATGRHREAIGFENALKRALKAHSRGSESAPMYLTLIRLDSALREGRRAEARSLQREAKKLESGVVGHLERTARRAGMDPAAYVARHYPD
jgi:hypothetical protein